jgi:hypothetical protein
MSDFPKLQAGILEGAMQALLDCKRKITAAEDGISGIIPLVENEETEKKLEEIREWCAKAAFTLQTIYNRNAKEAFKA